MNQCAVWRHWMLLDVIQFATFHLQFFPACMWPASWTRNWWVWQPPHTYCDCEEVTDFKSDNFANNFCNYKELKDFCSDKILQGIDFNREQFEQEQPAKLAEAIPCLDNSEQFSEVVEKEPTARSGKSITEEQLDKGIKHRIPRNTNDWGWVSVNHGARREGHSADKLYWTGWLHHPFCRGSGSKGWKRALFVVLR